MVEEVGKQNLEMTTIIVLACFAASSVGGGKWGPLVAMAQSYRVSRHFIWEREQERKKKRNAVLPYMRELSSES